jgi:hypothetical protein
MTAIRPRDSERAVARIIAWISSGLFIALLALQAFALD